MYLYVSTFSFSLSSFPFSSHNERKTQWEDPRLGITLPPADHNNPFGLHPRPMYPGGVGTGGDQLSHLQPHQPHHMPPNLHYDSLHNNNYSMRHHVNNRSVDVTALSGMGGAMEGGGMNPFHHRPQSANHQQSHSISGHMHGHGGAGYFGMGPSHGQLHSKRSFDFTMAAGGGAGMDHHRIPVTLQGDPYLSEHGRQASHDSGLGYPVTPYQGEQGMLDYDESGFDGGVPSMNGGGGPMGSSNQLNQDQSVQGVGNNHVGAGGGLLDHLPPGSADLGGNDQQQPMDFGGEMLGDFGNQPNQIFPTGEWV